METYESTTPFGRRSLTLAHVASQANAKARPADKAAHKWHVYQNLCAARASLGVTERALSVLNALLTFHPETMLTGDDLIVFPSNEQLARRAHGMPASTLRKHLAVLVDAGLIIRRDSPNGKRYARRGRDGEISLAFGFDLGPLVARAEEFERLAEELLAAEREMKLVRERITLCRRDIAKMIATGMEEGVLTREGVRPLDGWTEINALFRSIIGRIPRTATLNVLAPIADELTLLADEILMLLERHTKTDNQSASESISERHIQNSKPNSLIELEPALREEKGEGTEPHVRTPLKPEMAYPLGMVLDACPDICDYARDGITNWRDFMATAAVVRPMLGISPSAWEEAVDALGEGQAAVVVAAILQRESAISSAGGYLRELTRKAKADEFSLGRMLMALIGSRKREKKRA
ncbi:plasmid replication protein RepC [Xanthobacteraceae bacterium A53D]